MTTTTTRCSLAVFPWIVSEATLRSEDLLPAFWEAADQIRPGWLAADHPELLATLEKLVGAESSEANWDDETASDAVAELADALQELAPAGFSFSSHEGDGSCFGFWLQPEWVDILERFDIDDPQQCAELIAALDAEGIDADNADDAIQGVATGWTEERAGADYAAELAEECGMITGTEKWPLNCIDWDKAWRELELGDGFRLLPLQGDQWLVIRYC